MQSTPGVFSSAKAIPTSTTIMSLPYSKAVMFLPISDMPPRGMMRSFGLLLSDLLPIFFFCFAIALAITSSLALGACDFALEDVLPEVLAFFLEVVLDLDFVDFFAREFIGFADQKNFALDACTGKWALSLDADEILTKELAEEIAAIPDNTEFNGFDIHRVNYFLGGRMNHSGLNNEYILRLIRIGSGRYRDVLVHEGLEINGKITRLNNEMLHYSYADLENYFNKFNKYTSFAARDLVAKGRKFSLLGTLFRLPFEFLKRYVLKLGFLDGIRGFIWASCSTFYVFVKYIKLWTLTK